MLVDQDTEKVIVPLNNLKTTLGDASKAGHLEVSRCNDFYLVSQLLHLTHSNFRRLPTVRYQKWLS
jgi:hypothetical protein